MEDLLDKNMGLVISIVNRFNPKNSTEREDYIQAGRIGLWKALNKFCPERGTKFSPYAWNPIRWEIIKEIKSHMKHKHFSLESSGEDAFLYHNDESFWELMPSSLTEKETSIIKLKLEGYNLKEISENLDIERSQVRKLFNSAVKKIRDNNDK